MESLVKNMTAPIFISLSPASTGRTNGGENLFRNRFHLLHREAGGHAGQALLQADAHVVAFSQSA
jgi:hypothetical protein